MTNSMFTGMNRCMDVTNKVAGQCICNVHSLKKKLLPAWAK